MTLQKPQQLAHVHVVALHVTALKCDLLKTVELSKRVAIIIRRPFLQTTHYLFPVHGFYRLPPLLAIGRFPFYADDPRFSGHAETSELQGIGQIQDFASFGLAVYVVRVDPISVKTSLPQC